MKPPSLHIERSGGDSLIQQSPLFSLDSKLLFCTCSTEIKVFSTETGECVQRLIGHDKDVSSIAHHPKIKLQIVTSSFDGTIRIWDYEDGVLLKTCKIGHPIFGVYCHPKIQNYVFAVLRMKDGDSQLVKIALSDLEAKNTRKKCDFTVLASKIKNNISKPVQFLMDGKYIIFCQQKKICVFNTENENIFDYKNLGSGDVTCLACHPTDDCCVTGHTSGVIKFWHKLCSGNKKSKPVISTQHWHSDRVQDVCFSPGGASLLSIGNESVLVQWHYRESSGKKDFLPRLGAPARHIVISGDGLYYASTHVDNSILILTNYFTIRHTLEGFTASADFSNKNAVKTIAYDWKTGCCVTNGKPGHLLFYQPYSDKQLYNLDIAHQNYIASDYGSDIEQNLITNVAFSGDFNKSSRDGELFDTWMATVEEYTGDIVSKEQKMKFWIFDETTQWWKLNTVVNNPHKASVTKIIFRPQSTIGELHPALLSTSLDGMAKMWNLRHEATSERSFWSCFTTASHGKQPAMDGDFSQDGSLAGLAFGNSVCLSNPDSLQDLTVLSSFPKDENVTQILFGYHSCQHILMVVLKDAMHVFDLLTATTLWMVNVRISQLIREPLSSFVAAITDSNDLYIFQPTDAIPIYSHTKISDNNIMSAAFVPNDRKGQGSWLGSPSDVPWLQKSRLFFFDDKMSVYTICTDEDLRKKKSLSMTSNAISANAESLQTPLASVLHNKPNTKEITDSKEELMPTSELTHSVQLAALKQIIEMPCHVAPPVSTLCLNFLTTLLPKKSSTVNFEEKTIENKIDDSETEVAKKMVDLSMLDSLNSQSFEWATHIFDK